MTKESSPNLTPEQDVALKIEFGQCAKTVRHIEQSVIPSLQADIQLLERKQATTKLSPAELLNLQKFKGMLQDNERTLASTKTRMAEIQKLQGGAYGKGIR